MKAGTGDDNMVADPSYTVRVSWTLDDPNDEDYFIDVRMRISTSPATGNFNRVATALTSQTFVYVVVRNGFVRNGPYNYDNWYVTFRLDLVAKVGGAVLSSVTSTESAYGLGTCSELL